ncbi:MAG: hypothetical protein IJU44_08480 [Kiritimatiellae bacterium]|nr:hypothetical protein [Kiritimatiellia bacterium]
MKLSAVKLLIPALALMFTAGCVADRVIENTRVPELEISEFGTITLNGETVALENLAKAMRKAGFEKSQEVNVLIPDRPDRNLMKRVSSELIVKAGYTRTVFVKKRRALSNVPDPKK